MYSTNNTANDCLIIHALNNKITSQMIAVYGTTFNHIKTYCNFYMVQNSYTDFFTLKALNTLCMDN